VTCGGVDTVIRVPSTELSKEQRGGLPIGAKINLALPDNLVHLFDPETEENLL
jgi:multiple sugar transport system ATP-binding protein